MGAAVCEFLLVTIDVTCASRLEVARCGRDNRYCDVAHSYFAFEFYYWRFSSMDALWKFFWEGGSEVYTSSLRRTR